jgi:Protein of unknown function (DUF3443)
VSKYVIPLLFGVAFFAGCGGGGGGVSSPSASPVLATNLASSFAHNVLPISVDLGPTNRVNLPLASVTVCAPGSSSACQTVDGILIDTGSTGLRIVASALSAVPLPQMSDADGNPIAECAQFAEGSSWGPVRSADVRIAGEQANSLPIQVIGDPAFFPIPTKCANTGPSMNTVQTLGVNGYLGIGAFRHDCGNLCAQSSGPGIYYVCTSSGCQSAAIPLTEQLANPVSMFADDNNGVLVQLPAVPATGSANADGVVIFGIGTQSNNALGNASVFTTSTLSGGITTYYNGAVFNDSYIDSGSNALFFKDTSIPVCSSATAGTGFDCPVSTKSLSATIQGLNGMNASVTFSVANADSLIASGSTAFSNLAAPIGWSSPTLPNFDWGLPFFFGRNVFLAFEGANVAGAPAGPFVAF